MRNMKGITLIVLIVTIIVMLIIVGVAISTISTGGVPLGKIKKGAEEYKQGAINEAKDMNGVYGMLNQTEGETPAEPIVAQANAPVLAEGMTPVIWDETKQEWVETIANAGWYSYEEQTITTEQPGSGTSKWANVRMPDGSMFVWIPRYAYQISSGYHTGGEGVKGVIDVVFMKDATYTDYAGNANYGGPTTVPTYNGDKQTNWIVHPVFRANAEAGGWINELSGIWVAKFEASNTDEYGNSSSTANNADLTMQILPNKLSWRNIIVNNIYKACQNATYGYGTKPNTIDSHIMKNTEWGAIAYLAHSKYGRKGTEVSINNASGNNNGVTVPLCTTGYSGGTKISASKTDTTYSYETPQGQLASTTGNIYGVYDLSGGAWEYVAGLYTGSGVSSGTQAYYTNITNAAAHYKNTYTTYTESQYGDSVYETSSLSSGTNSWYADYSTFVNSDNSVFVRGGGYEYTTVPGLFFFSNQTGNSFGSHGFRPVLVVSTV